MPGVASITRQVTKSLEGKSRRPRLLSLPKAVAAKGDIDEWNAANTESRALINMLDGMCAVTSVEEVLEQVNAMVNLGHHLWANMFLRVLQAKSIDLFYEVMLSQASVLLPVMYTPCVGEVCQKYGMLPFYRRGCYLSITDRGSLKAALAEYAEAELEKDSNGKPLCDCIVFSDGGRILGLGDLGAWGMGIPIGKLDLYTVCGGVNPHRVIPLIIDAGCGDSSKNTDKLTIRDHPMYTGLKQNRVLHKSEAGTMVNSAYYGEDGMIAEFMKAATELFGESVLMQFEDFMTNDAFPLLAEFRDKYLTYNDDIQGTAAVSVAGMMGAIKLKKPDCTDLISALKDETFLFHGAGSANLGAALLLANEGKVDRARILMTNSRGLIWRGKKGSSEGSYRNNEQEGLAYEGKPQFECQELTDIIRNVKPTVLVGALGVAPNCFTEKVVEAMLAVAGDSRPIIFALSNPKTQAEITAENCYNWSKGQAIFGSGTWFDSVVVDGKKHSPGQVNNVYIFPGVSFGALCCQARTLPEKLFLAAAEAVASSLDAKDMAENRVIPDRDRVNEVSLNVAAAVAFEAQNLGLARKKLGDSREAVKASLKEMMWLPSAKKFSPPTRKRK
jgi:malate dehydrogenase (oxaloacetate-decarboxylating)(NADP+)